MHKIDKLWIRLLLAIAEDIRRGEKSGSEFVFYNMPYIAL
jgi:hypothetical protein